MGQVVDFPPELEPECPVSINNTVLVRVDAFEDTHELYLSVANIFVLTDWQVKHRGTTDVADGSIPLTFYQPVRHRARIGTKFDCLRSTLS